MFFKKKDRNTINGGFISDVLISITLNLMGKNEEYVKDYLKDLTDIKEDNEDENITLLFSNLNNGCVMGISIQNDLVYKICIYLNNKASEGDIQNLRLWVALQSEKYLFISMVIPEIKKHYIGFESKIDNKNFF